MRFLPIIFLILVISGCDLLTHVSEKEIDSKIGNTKVANPVFNPHSGVISSGNTVTISTSTVGASIRYTIGGLENPTSLNGTIFEAPITITSITIIKAIAYKTGCPDSEIVSSAYTPF